MENRLNHTGFFPLLQLPKHLIGQVSRFLTCQDIQSLSNTCKTLNEYLNDPEILQASQPNEARTEILNASLRLKILLRKQRKELRELKKNHEKTLKEMNEKLKLQDIHLRDTFDKTQTDAIAELQGHKNILLDYARQLNFLSASSNTHEENDHEKIGLLLHELDQYPQKIPLHQAVLHSLHPFRFNITLFVTVLMIMIILGIILDITIKKLNFLEKQYVHNPCYSRMTLASQASTSAAESTVCVKDYCSSAELAECAKIWDSFKENYNREFVCLFGLPLWALFQATHLLCLVLCNKKALKNLFFYDRDISVNQRSVNFLSFKHQKQLEQLINRHKNIFLIFNISKVVDFKNLGNIKLVLNAVKEQIPYQDAHELLPSIHAMLGDIQQILEDKEFKILSNNYLKTTSSYSSRFQLFSKIETLELSAKTILATNNTGEVSINIDETEPLLRGYRSYPG